MPEIELGRGYLGRQSVVRIGGTYDHLGLLPADPDLDKTEECFVVVDGERVSEPWEESAWLPVSASDGFYQADGEYGRLVFIPATPPKETERLNDPTISGLQHDADRYAESRRQQWTRPFGPKPTHVTPMSAPWLARFRLVPPYAHVDAGSGVIHTSFGFTRWHALGRAARWAQGHGADGNLRVSHWAAQETER